MRQIKIGFVAMLPGMFFAAAFLEGWQSWALLPCFVWCAIVVDVTQPGKKAGGF